MKTKVLRIILLGASLGLGSCSDYLDMTPTDRASDKLVWSKLDYAEQAVNDFYRYIDYLGAYRDGQCLAGNMVPTTIWLNVRYLVKLLMEVLFSQ
mgnify:CR=1 FL=1